MLDRGQRMRPPPWEIRRLRRPRGAGRRRGRRAERPGAAGLAAPTNGTVTHGSAFIWQDNPGNVAGRPTNTVISQTTSKAVINWNTFDVAGNESVTFNHMDPSHMTLNNVTSLAPPTSRARSTPSARSSWSTRTASFSTTPRGSTWAAWSPRRMSPIPSRSSTTPAASSTSRRQPARTTWSATGATSPPPRAGTSYCWAIGQLTVGASRPTAAPSRSAGPAPSRYDLAMARSA